MRFFLLLLVLWWPLGLRAQGLPAPGLPAGMANPDSLRAWQPRPPTADTVELKRLINGSNQRIRTNFDSARYLAQAAVALAWRRHQGIGLVYGLVMTSSAQYYANDFAAAQRSYELLLWAARRCHRPEQVGGAYMGMGLVARGLDNWAGAEQYFVQAQRAYAATQPPDLERQMNVLINRAYNFLDIDSVRRARPLVRQALALLRQLPQARHPAKSLVLLGLLYKKEGQFDSAGGTYRRAARLAHTTHNLNPEAESLLGLAELAARQPDHPLTLRYARQAEVLFRELGDPQEAEALRYQALALAALRQPTYATLRRCLTLTDSINAKQRVTTVANAQARFDQAAQQARIRALSQQQRISQLRAAQQATRARQYGGVAVGLLLLLAVLLYSRRRLQASEAALRQANGTQRELMRIIGHDLRGPVALFQQVTPLLRKTLGPAAPAEATELVQELHASAQHLGVLVDNLLDWARLQTGLVSCVPVALRAATAVLEVEQLYQPAARRKGLTLVAEVAPDLLVRADLNLLLTVLRNLLANALKFTPAGGTVRVAAEATAGGICFSVTDTGRGMSLVALTALMATGPGVSQPGTAGEAGTGLGLPLCRQFVALLGGTLRAETNADGPGLRFWFVLPAA